MATLALHWDEWQWGCTVAGLPSPQVSQGTSVPGKVSRDTARTTQLGHQARCPPQCHSPASPSGSVTTLSMKTGLPHTWLGTLAVAACPWPTCS